MRARILAAMQRAAIRDPDGPAPDPVTFVTICSAITAHRSRSRSVASRSAAVMAAATASRKLPNRDASVIILMDSVLHPRSAPSFSACPFAASYAR